MVNCHAKRRHTGLGYLWYLWYLWAMRMRIDHSFPGIPSLLCFLCNGNFGHCRS